MLTKATAADLVKQRNFFVLVGAAVAAVEASAAGVQDCKVGSVSCDI